MTPFDTATSSSREAVFNSAAIVFESPAVTASRNLRTAVLSSERTDLLRRRALSLVLMRFICDLIFATKLRPSVYLLIYERRRVSANPATPQTEQKIAIFRLLFWQLLRRFAPGHKSDRPQLPLLQDLLAPIL